MAQEKDSINFELLYIQIADKDKFIEQLISMPDNQQEAVLAKQCCPAQYKNDNIQAIKEAVEYSMTSLENNELKAAKKVIGVLSNLTDIAFNNISSLDRIDRCYNQPYPSDKAISDKKLFFESLLALDGKLEAINAQYQNLPQNFEKMLSDIQKQDFVKVLSGGNDKKTAKINDLIKDLEIVRDTDKLLTESYNNFFSEQEKEKSQFLKGVLNLDDNKFQALLEKQYQANPNNIENIIIALNPDKEIFLSVKEKTKNCIDKAKVFLNQKKEEIEKLDNQNKGLEILKTPYKKLTEENQITVLNALGSLDEPSKENISKIFEKQSAEDIEELCDAKYSLNGPFDKLYYILGDLKNEKLKENSSQLVEEVAQPIKTIVLKGVLVLTADNAAEDSINREHQIQYIENLMGKLLQDKEKMRGKLANIFHIDTGGIKQLKNILKDNKLNLSNIKEPRNTEKVKTAFDQIAIEINKRYEKYNQENNKKISQNQTTRKEFYKEQKENINPRSPH